MGGAAAAGGVVVDGGEEQGGGTGRGRVDTRRVFFLSYGAAYRFVRPSLSLSVYKTYRYLRVEVYEVIYACYDDSTCAGRMMAVFRLGVLAKHCFTVQSLTKVSALSGGVVYGCLPFSCACVCVCVYSNIASHHI